MRTDFNRHGPPRFKGEVELEKADLWIQEMDKIFETLHTPDAERVKLAAFMLKGDAEYWWRSARQLMTANHEAITWESFKRAFMDKYFPEMEDPFAQDRANQEVMVDRKLLEDLTRGHYANECGKEIVYWKCLKPGHVERNCPNAAKPKPVLNTARGRRPSAPGLVFAISGEHAAITDDLIQGMCIIAETSLMVLFDSGATHSFIAKECVKKLGLLTADLPFDLVVTTPAADRLVTRTACLQCPLIYENRTFLANLVCLGIKELYVILGMDWLTQYHVLLDCANKAVVFPDSGVTDYLNSYSLGRSSPAFVNSLVAEAKNDGDVRNILVVQDFVVVFPGDVPGLPPVREIEFSIDIMPDTGSISMAPYRMAPAELTNLGKQLDDLSSKGFIRPTVSPWGAPVLLVKKKDGKSRLCVDY
ncbi:uncharacterized protein LOC130736177 [Lotus japonicus]|uniref:uncharacterized protein LOC130736177 n=1 Tax=Lotus japonicus TaxID=34305 RepID=UPI00258507F8|nr:uncharacterized protein LOC130736177 [Lotus japonicus]